MCHVLIIEDEWLIAEYLADIAERAGATSTATAATQEEAVCAALDRRPSMILSDVTLEAGTGPAAVRTILAETGAIPVIFITGNPDACVPRPARSAVLQKPVNAGEVLDTFRQLMTVTAA